jgi:hypothetical protein
VSKAAVFLLLVETAFALFFLRQRFSMRLRVCFVRRTQPRHTFRRCKEKLSSHAIHMLPSDAKAVAGS